MTFSKSPGIEVPAMMFALAIFVGKPASAQIKMTIPTSIPVAAPSSPTAALSGEFSGPAAPATDKQTQIWDWHAQSTIIGQGYPSFRGRYSAANSLPTQGQARETVSLDLYGGHRLWRGAEAHIDVMTWQGFGLHGTLGIDDFPNGEAYKVGTRPPHTDIARLFIRQTIGLGGEKEAVPSDQLTLASEKEPAHLTFTVGRYSAKDIFDGNAYANDPRKQFMNWALVANITWDYPADSLGYTTGATIELEKPKWSLRYGFFQLPNQRNGFTAEGQFFMWPGDSTAGDRRFFHDWGTVAEGERRYSIHANPGSVRALAYMNHGEFGSYKAALSVQGADISQTHAERNSFGVGLNAGQEITRDIGVFSRVGWNDGHNEAWMFSDVNHSASLGVSLKGERWHLSGDTAGLAGVLSGISRVNRQYLKAGGSGILDGDGNLDYGREFAFETFYDHAFSRHFNAALDYQFFANPAFNRAQGPVSVFGMRMHWEF